MKHLTLNDFERLSKEISAHTENAEEWAESVGLDFDLLSQVGNVLTKMTHDRTMEAATEAFKEDGLDIDDPPEDVESAEIKLDVGGIIKDACISAFALGFETHKQYGGSDVGR